MGLRARLFVLLLLPMVLAMTGYAVLRLQREEQDLLAEEQRRMALTAKALQVAVENALRDRQVSDIKHLLDEVVRFQEEIDHIRILGPDLRPMLVSSPFALDESASTEGLQQAVTTQLPVSFFRRQDGRRVLYTFVPLRAESGRTTGAMEIVRLAHGIDVKIRAARVEIAQRIGLLTLLVGVLVWVGARWSLLLPIRRLMAGVQALAAGQPEPIPARGRDEFAELARAFNDMADRLAAAHRQLVAESETRLDLARQVRQAEQLAVAGRIASEVAHEIGTPLNIISGRAEQLLRDLAPDDPRTAALRTIVAQTDRIRGIMTSLLDVVRPRKAEMQPLELPAVLGGVVELLRPTARAKGLRLTTRLGGTGSVVADPNQLQQVAINLLMNAIEATPSGGHFGVDVRPAPSPDGRPGVELRVTDSGPGIPPEHLARIFDPFFTTKPLGQGTGLGLAICRDIVREHGGVIEIECPPGGGTTARVWLPAAPGP